LNTDEKNELINIIYFSENNRQVKTRTLAVLLSNSGMDSLEVANVLSIHPKTVTKHTKRYEEEGIEDIDL